MWLLWGGKRFRRPCSVVIPGRRDSAEPGIHSPAHAAIGLLVMDSGVPAFADPGMTG